MSAVNVAEVRYRGDEQGMYTTGLDEDLGRLGLDLVPFEVTDARLAQEVGRAGWREGRRLALGLIASV